MLYSGLNILHRSVVRRQTGVAARITRTLSRLERMVEMNEDDFLQLHRAIKTGQIQLVQTTVCSAVEANATNRFGWTPLMLAALEGNVKIGQLLVERGADINLTNNFGENALSCAALTGHHRFVQFLVSQGTDSDVRPHGHPLDVWIKQYSGLTDTQIAAILETIWPPESEPAG